jgi:MFS family permease
MVVMNVLYSLSAYPFGKLSDGMSHTRLLQWGLVVLIGADIVLALSTHWVGIIVGVALWGVHMGMTQGLLAAMVAKTAPADLRGTAFGIFSLLSGGGLLIASVGAGAIWETWGQNTRFMQGLRFVWRRWFTCVKHRIGKGMSILGNKKTNHKGWFFQDFWSTRGLKSFFILLI